MIEVISPWKDPVFLAEFKGRTDMIRYAEEKGIEIKSTLAKPYSEDENLMHISHEAGILEEPRDVAPEDVYSRTIGPEQAPDVPTRIRINFKDGRPTSVSNLEDGRTVTGALELFMYLNDLGAANGIGLALAKQAVTEGMHVVMTDVDHAQLETEAAALRSGGASIMTEIIDVSQADSVAKLADDAFAQFGQVDILMNNAGNAHGFDPIEEGRLDDWDAMIDINVKGLLYVSKAILPNMVAKKAGHIINIGSIAGKEVYPKGNVYCASKYAVDAINQGMRIDLNQYGIRVGAINPGLVETEFSQVRFKGDESTADVVYKGFQPLKPEDIADIILFVVTRPYHVNIADLLVMPTAQASSTIVKKEL